jgi:hypothetical protein
MNVKQGLAKRPEEKGQKSKNLLFAYKILNNIHCI